MKKRFFLTAIVAFLLGIIAILPMSASAEVPIRIKVGGEDLKTDVAPIIVEGRTLLPVRALFEAIGATVEWNGEDRTVTAQKDDTTILLTIDSDQMLVNGEALTLDVPAMIVNDRTLIPLRACAEAFDLPVEWSEEHRLVTVRVPVYQLTYHEKLNGNQFNISWETYEYDDAGHEIYNERSNGWWYKYEYDDAGNRIHRETSGGASIDYTYDAYGHLLEQKGYGGEIIRRYNDDGVLIYEKNGTDELKESFYDDQGKLLREVWHYDEDIVTVYKYDDAGHLIYKGDEEETSWTRYEYNDAGVLVHRYSTTGQELRYTDDGKLTYSVTFEESIPNPFFPYPPLTVYTTKEYDEKGRLTLHRVSKTGPYDSSSEEIYRYNDEDHEIYRSSDGKSWTERYDENDHLIFKGNDKKWDRYQYNEAGKLLYHDSSDGTWERNLYNDIGQKTYWENSEGEWQSWEQDETWRVIADAGHRKNMNGKWSDSYSNRYTFDAAGNKIYQEYTRAEKTGWEKWEYDVDNRLVRHETSTGEWETWEYDEAGLLRVEAKSTGARKEYDEAGNMTLNRDAFGDWEKWTYKLFMK